MSARILLIDDDRFARQVYGEYLSAAGHEVRPVASGEEGVARLGAEPFDLVVTDLVLPGMSGLEVLAEARRRVPDVGVVVVSALDVVDPAVRAIKGGAFDYLVKPVTADALQAAVERCLELRTLLRENAALRGHLALAETAARIAGADSAERVFALTAEALVSQGGAVLGLVAARPDAGPPEILSAAGGPRPDPWTLEAAVQRALEALEGPADHAAIEAPGAEAALGPGWAVPVGGPDTGRRVALAFWPPGAAPAPEALQAAQFLAGHATQALATLGRLQDAERLAWLDDLTQLFNARHLDRVLERQLRAAEEGRAFSVLFLDLDRFKEINDAHGHLTGSALLVEVAKVLRGAVRETDVAVRYGGDEYVLVLPDTDADAALHVAERLRARLEQRVFLSRERKGLRITASIGVATCPRHARDKRTLLEMADRAMYRGKRSTRNTVYLAAVPS